MKKRSMHIIIVAITCVSLALLLSIMLIAHFWSGSSIDYGRNLSKITFVGDCSANGGEFSEYNEDTKFNFKERNVYRFVGHFDRDVEKGESLVFSVCDMHFVFSVNGEVLMEQGTNVSAPFHSNGCAWYEVKSSGIKSTDTVELYVANLYKSTNFDVVSQVMDNMYIGTAADVFIKMLDENGFMITVAAMISAAGVIFLLSLLFARYAGVKWQVNYYVFGAAVIVAGIYFLYDTNFVYMSLYVPYPILNNVIDYSLVPLASLLFNILLACSARGIVQKVENVCVCITAMIYLACNVLQLLGVHDYAEMLYFVVSWVGFESVVVGALVLYDTIKHGTANFKECYYLMPIIVARFLEAANYALNYAPPKVFLRIAIGITLVWEIYNIVVDVKRANDAKNKILVMEKQLMENKFRLMQSQIKPHFLYNSLNAIGGLCLEDPVKADEAIVDFSNYLRSNIKTLDSEDLVPFSTELAHIKNYVRLEKLRFGERLNVIYDVGADDFMIPCLAIEPLVENAIKHGVAKRKSGGTVTLKTEELADRYRITVSDDGVGFTAGEEQKDGSVGLKNIKERLALLGRTTIGVESTVGVGTTVTVEIIKGEQG